jgi:hypothetical protein
MRVQKRLFHSILERLKKVVRKSGWLNRAVLGAVLATLCLAFPTASQQPEEAIVIEGQRFELGMSKDAALARIAECCMFIGNIISSKGPPVVPRGAIWFADGKVVTVRRDVGQFQEAESIVLGQTLYRLITEFTKTHGRLATVYTGETEGEGFTMRDISLDFRNGRRVILEINKVDANPKAVTKIGDWVDVYEVLEKP